MTAPNRTVGLLLLLLVGGVVYSYAQSQCTRGALLHACTARACALCWQLAAAAMPLPHPLRPSLSLSLSLSLSRVRARSLCPPPRDEVSQPTRTPLAGEEWDSANSQCSMCPKGKTDHDIGTNGDACKTCAAGQYTNFAGMIVFCATCAKGTYAGTGQSTCAQCTYGKVDRDQDGSTACINCDRARPRPRTSCALSAPRCSHSATAVVGVRPPATPRASACDHVSGVALRSWPVYRRRGVRRPQLG